MQRWLRPLLNLVIVGGLMMAAWPLGQTAYGRWNQQKMAVQWQRQEGEKGQTKSVKLKSESKHSLSPLLPFSPSSNTSASRKQPAKPRWPLTKLSIPDIGLETFAVQGMDDAALKRGPGHDVNSSPPGVGNCVIAGHRNVYGSFFYRLDELLPGAPITLENRDGKWNYVVNTVFMTPDTDLTVLKPPAPSQAPILTLITCTLPHSGNRIILQASLNQE